MTRKRIPCTLSSRVIGPSSHSGSLGRVRTLGKIRPMAFFFVHGKCQHYYESGQGGEGHDIGVSITVDPEGNAYVAGYTNSPTFPTTPGAFQPQLGRGICDFFGTPCGDAFVTKIAAGGPGVVPAVSVSVTPLEVAPGGTLTATWAGITTPSSSDSLALVSLRP